MNTGTDQDVRNGNNFQGGTPGTQGFIASNGGVAIAFRVQDASDYWGFCVTVMSYAAGPQGNYYWSLFNMVSGTVTLAANGTVNLWRFTHELRTVHCG